MTRHLDRIARVWDAISAAEQADQVGFCLDTCHAHAGGNALETVVEDVLDDHRPDRPGARQRQPRRRSTPAPTGTPTSAPAGSTPTCSPRWSATPAPRSSARPPGGADEHTADFDFLRDASDFRRPTRVGSTLDGAWRPAVSGEPAAARSPRAGTRAG